MTHYAVKLEPDQIRFLIDTTLASVADHALSEEDTIALGLGADTIVFDDIALDRLRDLPPDWDGSITSPGTEEGVYYPLQIWFDGTGYEISTIEPTT